MPALDIFNNDAFSVASLTAAINEQPYVPGRIGKLGLFQEEGITTTQVLIEHVAGLITLVANSERGAPVAKTQADKSKMRSFVTAHLKRAANILADEVQNLRAFGSESEEEAVQNYVNQRLAKLGRDLEATLEYQRIGAIRGQILDADGTTVIYDLYSEFGITQTAVDFILGTAGTKVRNKVREAMRASEDALGAASATGYRAFCSDVFFDKFIEHDKVAAAFDRYNDGEMLRNDPRAGFEFGGVVWENYRGKVGATPFIPDGDALLVPEGVADLFITRFAPADYMETVNTLGLPKYSKQEPLPMNRGVDLEAQSNPISLCTRPGAVIRLHSSN